MNLLLVEDEERIADFVRRGLAAEGWSVTHVDTGEAALEFLELDRFDIVLLDVMLPGMSGIDVCRRMRIRNDLTPVLMLTAMGAVEERVSGLRQGADDYLPKPFDFDELLARLMALRRRAVGFSESEGTSDGTLLRCGTITYDLEARRVCLGETEVDLTKREREVLLFLMRNPDRLVSRERLLNAVWGFSEDPLTNVVDVHVARLRRKLGSAGNAVKTLRGEGYLLDTRAATVLGDPTLPDNGS